MAVLILICSGCCAKFQDIKTEHILQSKPRCKCIFENLEGLKIICTR